MGGFVNPHFWIPLLIATVVYGAAFIAMLYLTRYVMGIKRFLAIAEENVALNRERTAHAEKTADQLASIREHLEKQHS